MPLLSRRTFVGWIGAMSAALGIRKQGDRTLLPSIVAAPGSGQPGVLDAALLLALAEAVLPRELGASGTATAAKGFGKWLSGYRGEAELLHGYGTAELSFAAASPMSRWHQQLLSLDEAARAQGGKGFAAVAVDLRQQLVRTALSAEKLTGFPAPQAAGHVAVGMMAWYFGSPDATDRCYRAEIGKNRCRPLALNPNEPLPLHRNGPAPRGLMPEGDR